MIDLSVVIPAYNESDRIQITLEKTLAYLATRPYSCEVVVVSDGSRDDTRTVAEGFAAGTDITVRALEYHPNRGKGYAVKYGMLRARGRVVMFMDADYAVPMSDVEPGLALIERGFDVAIGSRGLSGSRVTSHQNLPREISARVYTLIQNTYLGIRYPDTQCGFKLFTQQAAQALFSRQKLCSVIFDPEILWLAKRLGFSTAEFPVTWRHVENSRIQYDSLKKSLFVFRELFRIRALHRGDRP